MKNKVEESSRKKTPPLVPKIDFDGTWKEIIETFLPDFIAFFLPKLHEEIDYSVPPTYLDKELQHILETKGYKKKTTDKLIKMRLKNGESKWILLHVEVQSYFEKLFGRRMFIIFSWLFSKYDESLVALAIYTGDKVPKVFNHFEEEAFGTKVRFDFNTYRVMQQKEADLLALDNIFSLFVLANKYVNETRAEKQLPNRLRMKQKIYELALEREIDEQRIARFLIFVDRIMLLPNDLKDEFKEFLNLKLSLIMRRAKPFDPTNYSAHYIASVLYKEATGLELADLEKVKGRLFMSEKEHKKERMNAEKERMNAEKERMNAEKERMNAEKEHKKERINAEKERINAEKERMNAEKEHKKEREAIVLKLHLQDWSSARIADVLEYDLAWVEGVLSGKKKKKK